MVELARINGGSNNLLDCMFFTSKRAEQEKTLHNLIDFKPLWAIRRNIADMAAKEMAKESHTQAWSVRNNHNSQAQSLRNS